MNPYLYRGYRYDTETGLYYLQSRYYNSDWGRFINADGIAATTGELLSGNMFAYSKNNPVNMADADGDRPEFSDGSGRETQDDIDASLSTMSKVNTVRYANAQRKASIKSGAISSGASATDAAAGKKVFEKIRTTKESSVTARELGVGFEMETEVPKIGASVGKFVGSKLGVLSIATTGYSLFSDYQNNHGVKNIAFSMLVDAVGFSLGVAAGAFIGGITLPIWGTILAVGVVAAGICYLDDRAKQKLRVN